MASPAKKAKITKLPVCPYGARCYRKNPAHFKEYEHPPKDGSTSDEITKHDDIDTAKLKPCPFGANCYRKNLLHYAEYSHPTSDEPSTSNTKPKASKADDDSGNETDVISSDEEDEKKKKGGKNDILKRGMSLVKNYSQMSEDERKDLIKKAMKAKQQLQKELKDTQDEMKKKEQKMAKLQKEVNTGILLVDGEKEALEGKKTVYFNLHAERKFKEGSADQTHFRLAESQYYRLLSGSHVSSYRVTKVEYVVNPDLVRNFKQAREDLKLMRGEDVSYPVLAFHGTNVGNIPKICEGGFLVPGAKGFQHKTDTGYYGKGVYFSEFPAYSMGYIAGATKLLLCQVLPGKVYECTKLIHGHALMKGYDSHTSPCKKELIVFNSHHLLPSYIVHYTQASAEFNYSVTGLTDVEKLLEPTELMDKYQKASMHKIVKNLFFGYTFQFTGTFMDSQANMMNLVVKHGGKKGTPNVFTILVASPDEFKIKTSKVTKAEKGGKSIVVETFIYDSIIASTAQDITKYSLA